MKGIVLLVITVFGVVSSKEHPLRKSPEGRIIGGDPAIAGQFPWQAAIYVTIPQATLFCSGALINRQWVLTAASCTSGATRFTVQLGSNQLQTLDPNRLTLSTSISVTHPDYNNSTLENNVGLIQFHMPIEYNAYIQAIAMANQNMLPGDLTVTISGWGQASDNTAGIINDLSFVKLSTITNDECKLTYGDQVRAHMACAVGQYNEGICLGDIGGALVRPGVKGNPTHVGIAVFLSQNGCETVEPTGYARTDYFHKWISSVTKAP